MKVSISILRVQENAWASLYQRLSITLKIISILFEKRPDYIPYWLTILGLQNARYKKIEILPHLFQIKNKIHYTQRNKIATYFVSKNQNISLSFSEEELIIFYHLLRFGYFDKEIIDLIYTAVTRKSKTPNSWFYRLVGKVNHPISACSDARSGKRKIYYLNKGFSTWLLTMIKGIDKYGC